MSQFWVIVLLAVSASGLWFGFAEDLKIGVAFGIAAMFAVTYYVFHGGFRALEELPAYVTPIPTVASKEAGKARPDLATIRFSLLIVIGTLVTAVGFWFAFAEDLKPALLVGVLAAAISTLATFRGKVAS